MPVTLQDLGRKHGTDKADWGYLPVYERVFAPWREESCQVLEIGVKGGDSLRLWEEWFPKASIVGLDIDPACKAVAGGRRQVIIGNQARPQDWVDDPVLSGRPLGVVIDDGSHRGHDIEITFRALWPHLASGGIYAIEDLGAHYYTARYGPTLYPFLWDLTLSPNPQEKDVLAGVASVEFHKWLCIVRKA